MRNRNVSEKHILLVEPDEAFGDVLQEVLGSGYVLRLVPSVEAGIAELDAKDLDVVLLNVDIPQVQGASQNFRDLLRAAAERLVSPSVIAYGWGAHQETAVEAFQLGAVDFLAQPLDIRELKFALDGAFRRSVLARDLAAAQSFLGSTRVEGLLGNSLAMERVSELVRKVADVFTTVLLTGESGTGKGVVAQAIHRLSQRAEKPFVGVSMCVLSESLIEDELFGHERGAFTGATQSRRGRFEEANGGTIFLDEIGDLALPLQTKLLRVLQERTVERLGSNVAHPVDVRVLCATNRNLEKMVQEGTFREDLYYRISVVKIHMPALRERMEDIPFLAEYFVRLFAKVHNKRTRGLTPGYLSALAGHNWPGNVRELQNVIERSLVLANGNAHLGVKDLPPELKGWTVSEDVPRGSFHDAVLGFKRELIRAALRMHAGNKLRAAQELRISRCYLHRMLKQLKLKDADVAGRELQEGLRPESPRGRGGSEEFRLNSRVV